MNVRLYYYIRAIHGHMIVATDTLTCIIMVTVYLIHL